MRRPSSWRFYDLRAAWSLWAGARAWLEIPRDLPTIRYWIKRGELGFISTWRMLTVCSCHVATFFFPFNIFPSEYTLPMALHKSKSNTSCKYITYLLLLFTWALCEWLSLESRIQECSLLFSSGFAKDGLVSSFCCCLPSLPSFCLLPDSACSSSCQHWCHPQTPPAWWWGRWWQSSSSPWSARKSHLGAQNVLEVLGEAAVTALVVVVVQVDHCGLNSEVLEGE